MPNAQYMFSEPYGWVYAIRDIKEGDELCISYVASMMQFDRQPTIDTVRNHLNNCFGFDCTCKLCGMKDKTERNKIEKHRVASWDLYKKMRDRRNENYLEQLNLVKDIFIAMEKGKLLSPPLIAMHAHDGFQLSVLCKQPQKAADYIKQAYEANLIGEGEDSPTTKRYLHLVKNPQHHHKYVVIALKYLLNSYK